MRGIVQNRSSKVLWVVETDSGHARAHRLAQGWQSPASVDADGFKAVDGTPIDGHTEWIKLVNISTAEVKDAGNELTRGCIACLSVGAGQFGDVQFIQDGGWGEKIP